MTRIRRERQADDAKAAGYAAARAAAQANADASGLDYGFEWNPVFRQWSSFALPRRENRSGHELRCEVVSPAELGRCHAGHGPL